MRLTLHTFQSVDGVMQAPGSQGEDREGSFQHGGWAFAYDDDEASAVIRSWYDRAGAFLFGRTTYLLFSNYWPKVTDPNNRIAAPLNTLPKYVATSTLKTVDWQHSTILGDVMREVVELKDRPGKELQVHGSGVLARALIEHNLVDEYRLLTFPVHLGAGKRLFTDQVRAGSFRLLESVATKVGIVYCSYEPAGAVNYASD
ncbi:MAG: dihydrofolate reductase family protein [Candidatus Dormibacteraeota bacterium]|nr:dihydrofolate reductase family protein [Candidatus Dormibacteraeota bacterium]